MKDNFKAQLTRKINQHVRENQFSGAVLIRRGKTDGGPAIRPSRWLYWNVHIDGLERTHDLSVEREGVFRECVAAVRMAKLLGQAEKAYAQVQEIAVRAIEGSAGAKQLASLQQLLADQARKPAAER